MDAVFAAWALADGFRYPAAPGPLTLNAVSKVLALAAALTLLLPIGSGRELQGPARQAAGTST